MKNGKSLLAGIALGVALGVLIAPKKGSETRAELAAKLKSFLTEIEDFDDISYDFEDKIAGMISELSSLDTEKISAVARKQARNIKQKADDIYELAKEKGTDKLKESAEEIQKSANDVLNEENEKEDV